MRVALVHPAFGAWGGAENMLLWIAQGLQGRGHEVVVHAGVFSERARELFAASCIPLHELRHMHGQSWARLQLRFRRGLPRLECLPLADHVVRLDVAAMRAGAREVAAALRGFDVVNVHNYPATWWLAAAREAAASTLPPVLWYCQEPPRNLYPSLFDGAGFDFHPDGSALQEHDRTAVRALHRICCNGRYIRDRVQAIYQRPDATFLSPGLPLEAYLGIRPEGPQREAEDYLRVLAVGRLVVAKNVSTLIDAVARARGVRLTIVGEGPERASLMARAQHLGVEDRVVFRGFVADRELPACYAAADVFASLPVGEPFGLILVEAAAAGLPALTSDHGGPAEIVLDGQTGWHVPPHDAEQVAETLRALVAKLPDRSQLQSLGAEARRRAVEVFGLVAFLDRFERLLEATAQAGSS